MNEISEHKRMVKLADSFLTALTTLRVIRSDSKLSLLIECHAFNRSSELHSSLRDTQRNAEDDYYETSW